MRHPQLSDCAPGDHVHFSASAPTVKTDAVVATVETITTTTGKSGIWPGDGVFRKTVVYADADSGASYALEQYEHVDGVEQIDVREGTPNTPRSEQRTCGTSTDFEVLE